MFLFRDSPKAKEEEEQYLSDHRGDEGVSELESLRRGLGTLEFQRDLDALSSKVFAIHQERWLIELLFK